MTLVRIGSSIVLLTIAAAAASHAQAPSRTFKVATWNVRSGMGSRGFTTTSWNHDTLNCTDRSKPLNAWGVGLPQRELERIRADASIVALAVQEAWNCASPTQVNGVLGFAAATREENGTALLARYGFSGKQVYERIDARNNNWAIGGRVCLDASCSVAVPMFSTHLYSEVEGDIALQAGRLLRSLHEQPLPHLLLGDLNAFKIDQWNPRVACTGRDAPDRTSVIAQIESAGYADAWKATQGGEGWTGMASRAGCGSPSGNLYQRIDYVYAKGLTAVSASRFARAAPGADSPSDHVGLIAELAWPVSASR
jgi:endonuclease/exonuclease/phosphatase family metal-dependent hydrolase